MEVEENIRKVEYRSERATQNTAWSARIKKKIHEMVVKCHRTSKENANTYPVEFQKNKVESREAVIK